MAHIIFISKVPIVTSPVMILNLFSEMTLGDGPKKTQIRVKDVKPSVFVLEADGLFILVRLRSLRVKFIPLRRSAFVHGRPSSSSYNVWVHVQALSHRGGCDIS